MNGIKLKPIDHENYSSPSGVVFLARILYSLRPELRAMVIEGAETGELPLAIQAFDSQVRKHIKISISGNTTIKVLGRSIDIVRNDTLSIYEARNLNGAIIGTHRIRSDLDNLIRRKIIGAELNETLKQETPDYARASKLRQMLDSLE